ncbi:MAG: YraN family protein [Niabella sp.]
MLSHNQVGKGGENLAASFLMQNGYEVLHQNWRYSYYEIDIIAKKSNKLHFVEVKTRSSAIHGHPEQAVTKKKFKFLQKAAHEYLQQYPGNKWIQYDIVSITLHKNKAPEFFLLEDVFL